MRSAVGWWCVSLICTVACGPRAEGAQSNAAAAGATNANANAQAGTSGASTPSPMLSAGQPSSSVGAVSATTAVPATAGHAAPPPAGTAAASAGAPVSSAGTGNHAAGTGSAGSAAGSEATQTCAAAPLKPGNSTRQIQSNSRMRSYLLHVPTKYAGMAPVPLVFDFHGYSSSPMGQMGASGFRELGDQEGFIVVYPQGVGASWHVNGCCGQAGKMKLDEIAFVRAIFDELKRDACVDLQRVYATGISQGGGMAHHVACLAADIFAGVAPVSSDLRTDPCMPARAITEISFRGLADSLDAYEGGHVGPPGMEGYTAIGAKPTLEKWKLIDQCTGNVEKMNDLCETYTTCQDGVAVSLCSIPGADHVLYQNTQGLNVPKLAWELFKQHPRRQ